MQLQLLTAPAGFNHVLASALGSLNWWGILLAFGAYYLLGAAWYLVLFPNLYRVSLGKAGQALQNQGALYLAGPAACVLVVVLASAVLLAALRVDSYGGALLFALLVGGGYLVSNTTNVAINPNIPRPFLYSFITSTYHLAGLTLASLIMVALR